MDVCALVSQLFQESCSGFDSGETGPATFLMSAPSSASKAAFPSPERLAMELSMAAAWLHEFPHPRVADERVTYSRRWT